MTSGSKGERKPQIGSCQIAQEPWTVLGAAIPQRLHLIPDCEPLRIAPNLTIESYMLA